MRRTLSRGSRTRKLACAALRAVAAAVLLAAAAAGPAWAHASLDATTPEAGAALKAAPGQVELRFSEPVETAFGALRVYDAQRHDVHVGAPFHPGGDRSRLAVRLRPRLPDGGYTAVFRVISADSHPASGGFTFDVGTTTSATRAAGVADLLGGAGIGPMTGAMTNLVRAAEYGAIAIAVGGLAVLLLVWLPALRAVATSAGSWQAASDRFDRMLTRVLLAAALVGVGAVALALPLEAAAAQGTTFWSALDDVPLVLSTRFGTVWAMGGVAWLAVVATLAGNRSVLPPLRSRPGADDGGATPARPAWLAVVAVALLALAFLPGLAGHAGARRMEGVLLPANVLHVLAASAWIGGLCVLAIAVPAATRALADGQRTRLLAGVFGRFSGLAIAAVGVLLLAGILQSLLELGSPGHLLDTSFGRAVCVKCGVVCGLLAFGAVNRSRTIPALDRAAANGTPGGRAGRTLMRTLRNEVALGLTAVLITGALAGYQPPAGNAPGPAPAAPAVAQAR